MKHALIVGCGLVGSVIARELANSGYQVTIWERRNHIAGNLYDYTDDYGILVQEYGPHIFHTNNDKVYQYVHTYSEWKKFSLVCGAFIDGICTPTAFNLKTIDLFYDSAKATQIKEHINIKFPGRESATVVELLDCDDNLIREYAQFLFDKDYSLYTAKQWGVTATEIDKSVLRRVPIRLTYEEAYFKDKYEEMPVEGYTSFVRAILDHKNIDVQLGIEALQHIKIDDNTIYVDGEVADYPVVYTGPLDELFSYSEGRLPYRSLRFEWKHDNTESYQEFPVVAYPQAEGYTRITEYKKLPVQEVSGTSYAVEYPLPYNPKDVIEPYYPVLTDDSHKQYRMYAEKAKRVKNLYPVGRLAEFKYYNMDQAIEKALELSERLDAKSSRISH